MTYLIKFLWELNVLLHAKGLVIGLAHSRLELSKTLFVLVLGGCDKELSSLFQK